MLSCVRACKTYVRTLLRGPDIDRIYGAKTRVRHEKDRHSRRHVPQGCFLPLSTWPEVTVCLCVCVCAEGWYSMASFLLEISELNIIFVIFSSSTTMPTGDGGDCLRARERSRSDYAVQTTVIAIKFNTFV